MDISLFSAKGEAKGQVNLKEYFGEEEFQGRTLHEVMTTYQRNLRSGTSMTKTRGLVRGGGRKPWKQKGTGNARAGSIRSPLWRKGGIIFGPVPRSFRVDLPEVKRSAALRSAIRTVEPSSVMDGPSVRTGAPAWLSRVMAVPAELIRA